jgi:hypothetical protein
LKEVPKTYIKGFSSPQSLSRHFSHQSFFIRISSSLYRSAEKGLKNISLHPIMQKANTHSSSLPMPTAFHVRTWPMLSPTPPSNRARLGQSTRKLILCPDTVNARLKVTATKTYVKISYAEEMVACWTSDMNYAVLSPHSFLCLLFREHTLCIALKPAMLIKSVGNVICITWGATFTARAIENAFWNLFSFFCVTRYERKKIIAYCMVIKSALHGLALFLIVSSFFEWK